MDRLIADRAGRSLYSAYAISFFLHLSIIGVMLLTLLPMGLHQDPLDLQVTVDEVGAKLVVLDVTVAKADVEEEPLLLDVIGDQSEASFDITFPFAQLAVGKNGTGQNHATAGTSAGADGGRGQASFFGTQATGDRFVYVLDVSGSMNQGNGRRLKRAVRELLRSIDQLRDDQMFYVLLFASSTRQMFDKDSLVPAMLPATKENKARVRKWIMQVKATGGTQPQRALHVGLNLSPSAVFFLSDGKFNKPKPTGFFDGEAVDAKTVVQRANPGKIPVHAIAFEDPASRDNMNEISKMTGGEFRYVYRSGKIVGTTVSSTGKRSRFAAPAAKPPGPLADLTAADLPDPLAELKAAKWMGYADDMEAVDNKRMARYYYAKVLRDFPDTNAAREARQRQVKSE